MQSCPHCGSFDIERDGQRGDSVCVACGHVLEENVIVSEVSFVENADGSSSVVGQFVPSGKKGTGAETREATINNGNRIITHLVTQLRLSHHHTEAAQRLFLLAVQRNFLQGRRTPIVAAACLYIVCRRDRSPHMLLDFAEVIQENVFVLGHCFLKLIRLLNLTLPIVDPSLYIHRFASRMDYGPSTHQVAMTALRLVACMKRDWLQVGRRPAGICAAALYLAGRMHGFKRTQSDVIQVLRICSMTLRRRLEEFALTPAADQTVEEFEKYAPGEDFVPESATAPEDTVQEVGCNPPAFVRAQQARDALKAQRRMWLLDHVSEMEELLKKADINAIDEELGEIQEEGEVRFDDIPHAAFLLGEKAPDSSWWDRYMKSQKEAERRMAEADESLGIDPGLSLPVSENGVALETCDPKAWYKVRDGIQTTRQGRWKTVQRSVRKKKEVPPQDAQVRVGGDDDDEAAEADESGNASDDYTVEYYDEDIVVWTSDEEEEISDSELEKEAEEYMLSPEECEAREVMWTATNKSYLEEMERRRQSGEDPSASAQKKRRVKAPSAKDSATSYVGRTAVDSASMLFKSGRVSSKINYQALKNIFTIESSHSSSSAQNGVDDAAANASNGDDDEETAGVQAMELAAVSGAIDSAQRKRGDGPAAGDDEEEDFVDSEEEELESDAEAGEHYSARHMMMMGEHAGDDDGEEEMDDDD